MADPHEYPSPDITVTWSKRRCIHVAECVRGLMEVFEPGRRPWVVPENSNADEVARVIHLCPSGALHYERHDGGAAESPDAENSARATRNGPLEVRGDLRIATPGGEMRETRASFCRCGQSQNKPFCDGSHHAIAFRETGELSEGKLGPAVEGAGPLRVTARRNGPLRLEGPFVLVSADRRVRRAAGEVALCRCGQSKNKPFCDKSHRESGFAAEALPVEPGEDPSPD